ncbi:MAG: bifunctional pyr operon transcriptional regulator/uracil phosphoribosyltransferase PyrR [Victivallaceae bacterium]|nr:bifunctional pyr operon transcriptional regulator/uracil phosphoribosyltransferase PyrR [Victivallaceae bacterium]NLK83562.1 bifunctional pyr operon transcriptional regulator/uracil phosphoribosyltransferase PyrR [Lentisphaerota bacterium]MDD3117220.1 bifunctional pyr operon transcriptional regulator/uracil phosphoribosyltransferase PyrR [Victivallaceae bacterium]MDD3702681.1 bifunctional pyr operon transcriptional regulator/uracil phosphoribosyltransferase PyrR [Victivallaceae bacterium]MDD
MTNKTLIFDKSRMDEALTQISAEIISEFKPGTKSAKPLALLGIQRQGVPFAHRLRAKILELSGFQSLEGVLDINMYRDDYSLRKKKLPIIRETDIPFNIDDCNVIIADDVLASGRSVRAALDALTDYGRPRLIRLAIMVDRCRYEFPIRADYVGFVHKAPVDKKILVEFEESEGADGIYEMLWDKAGVFKG